MYTNRLSFKIVLILALSMILLAACGSAVEPTVVGTWTTTVTKEDILRAMPDFHQEALCDNTGTFVWQFNADGTFTVDQTALPDCPVPANTHFEAAWVLDGNQITFAKGTPEEEIYEIAINSNQLTFKVVSSECPPCIAVNTVNPWTRVE